MTIADKLTRLTAAHDAIISAINAKGGSATGDGFEDFAADIAAIPSGGGGSSYTLLASKEIAANFSSSTASVLDTISAGSGAWDKDTILYVRIRDKAGKRSGYCFGADNWLVNINAANGSTTADTIVIKNTYSYNNGTWAKYVSSSQTGYGLYVSKVEADGTITISVRYNSTSSRTINGTYLVEVYALNWPGDEHPFA